MPGEIGASVPLRNVKEQSSDSTGSRLYRAVHQVEALVWKRSGTPSWMTELTSVVEELRDTNRTTESDFLAVGGKLMGFLSAARAIRTDIAILADCISGAGAEQACAALAAVLDRSKEIQKRVEEASGVLGRLSGTAAKIQRDFSLFDNTVSSFRVVATLGRIETGRLANSQSDLGHLADEVGSCTEEIRGSVESALQEADRLGQRIDLSIEQISALDVRQLAALPALIGAVETSLEAFRQRQQQANETSASLAGKFKSFSEAINDIATAVQFHDITRQQIEHVVESLTHLVGDGDVHGRTACPSADDLAVVELQRRQLLGAAGAFAASVEQVKCQLEQVASGGREMAREAETLLGLAQGQHGSFFDQMERCFAGVLAAVSNCNTLNDETANAAAELQRSIAGLQSRVAVIRAISFRINRLALNATIEAVHLGAVGEPLSVVAGGMQALRVEVEKRSDETESSLDALKGAVLSTAATAQAPNSALRSGDTAVTDELRTRIDELHVSSERSLTCSKQISAAAANLCADVQLASDSFTVGDLFDEALDRCCGVLQRITAECGLQEAGTASGLHHVTARYTMQSERDVHEMATAQTEPATSPTEQPDVAVPAVPGGFGDNVELF